MKEDEPIFNANDAPPSGWWVGYGGGFIGGGRADDCAWYCARVATMPNYLGPFTTAQEAIDVAWESARED